MENMTMIDVAGRGTGAHDSTSRGFRLRGIGGFVAGGVAPSPAPVADAAFPAVQVK